MSRRIALVTAWAAPHTGFVNVNPRRVCLLVVMRNKGLSRQVAR